MPTSRQSHSSGSEQIKDQSTIYMSNLSLKLRAALFLLEHLKLRYTFQRTKTVFMFSRQPTFFRQKSQYFL